MTTMATSRRFALLAVALTLALALAACAGANPSTPPSGETQSPPVAGNPPAQPPQGPPPEAPKPEKIEDLFTADPMQVALNGFLAEFTSNEELTKYYFHPELFDIYMKKFGEDFRLQQSCGSYVTNVQIREFALHPEHKDAYVMLVTFKYHKRCGDDPGIYDMTMKWSVGYFEDYGWRIYERYLVSVNKK